MSDTFWAELFRAAPQTSLMLLTFSHVNGPQAKSHVKNQP